MHQVLSLGRTPLWQKQALTFLAGFLALWPVASEAIDCTLAKTPTELAICADPALAKLDAQLNRDYQAFRDAYQKSVNHQCDLAKETAGQKDWLKKRDACGSDAKCIEDAYQSRIEGLGLYGRACTPEDCTPDNKGKPCAQHCSAPPTASNQSAPKPEPKKNSCEKISSTDNPKEIADYYKSHLILSENGRQFIKVSEAKSLCMYEDRKQDGFATIGYGHLIKYDKNGHHPFIRQLPTRAPKEFEQFRNGISLAEAEMLLTKDVNEKLGAIKHFQFVKVTLTQCQIDALADLVFQTGAGKKRELWSAINNCNLEKAAKIIENISGDYDDRKKRRINLFTKCEYGRANVNEISCCSYTAANDYPNFSKGSTYQARCLKKYKGRACKLGGACYDF